MTSKRSVKVSFVTSGKEKNEIKLDDFLFYAHIEMVSDPEGINGLGEVKQLQG